MLHIAENIYIKRNECTSFTAIICNSRSTASRKTNATSLHPAGGAANGAVGGTLTSNAANGNFAMINGSRAPPRPAPSMVNYSDEDDSAKGYDENPDDSDSLTEKPSEISSTDSQVNICTYLLHHQLNGRYQSLCKNSKPHLLRVF